MAKKILHWSSSAFDVQGAKIVNFTGTPQSIGDSNLFNSGPFSIFVVYRHDAANQVCMVVYKVGVLELHVQNVTNINRVHARIYDINEPYAPTLLPDSGFSNVADSDFHSCALTFLPASGDDPAQAKIYIDGVGYTGAGIPNFQPANNNAPIQIGVAPPGGYAMNCSIAKIETASTCWDDSTVASMHSDFFGA